MFYFKNGELFKLVDNNLELIWAFFYDDSINISRLLDNHDYDNYYLHNHYSKKNFTLSEAVIPKERFNLVCRNIHKLLMSEMNSATKISVDFYNDSDCPQFKQLIKTSLSSLDKCLTKIIKLLKILEELERHVKKYFTKE